MTSDERKVEEGRVIERPRNRGTSGSTDFLRVKYEYYIVALSLVLVAVIFLASAGWHALVIHEAPDDKLPAMMTAAFAVIVTLVGTFVGHHFGAAGREKAEKESRDARREKELMKSKVLRKALTALPDKEVEKLLDELEETEQSTTE